MNTTPNLTLEAESNQRFIDKQMAGVIEAIVTHAFSLSNKGFIPSDRQLAAYVDSLDAPTLLQMIRKHPEVDISRR